MDVLPTKNKSEYKQLAHIGRGSYGDVFLCEHVPSGEHVCAKEIDLTFRSSVEREQCVNEVALLKSLPAHPNIVAFREAFWASSEDSAKILIIVLECADGGDLEQHLNAGGGHLIDQMEAQQIFLQIARGVEHLHAHGVVHRDLKSSNIFLFRSGRAVLGDFGAAKVVPGENRQGQELLSTMVGSPLYMSPELLDGELYGYPTDIWSLGCILYELLSGGRPAFAAPSYPAVVFRITQGQYDPLDSAVVSQETQDLLAKMLRKIPVDRPSIQQVLQSPWLQRPEASGDAEFAAALATALNMSEAIPKRLPEPSHSTLIQPPPAPAHAIQSKRTNVQQYGRNHRERIAHGAIPLIKLDLMPPPPALYPPKPLPSTPSIPSKQKPRQEHRSHARTNSLHLEIRGIRIAGRARQTHN